MARRHWIWDAYRALTQERRMTEAEAIGELTALWPSLPVFEIVRAEGDLSRTLGDLIEPQQQSQGSSGQQQQQGNQQGSGNQQQEQIDPNDFNAVIRARASRNGAHTAILPRSALTGIKDDPEYDGSQDFVRQGFRDKYGIG
jgi:hypothetical protein